VLEFPLVADTKSTSKLDEDFYLSVNYLTLLNRFLNDAAERGRMAVHLANVG
jgi:hypothetical protein